MMESMDECKEQQLLIEEDPTDSGDSLKSTPTVSSKEEEEADDLFLDEVWKCSSCQQIYASMWPKCPGCLKSDTHFKTYT